MSKTVLVVEDDPLSRKLSVDLLVVAGYRPLQASDGGEAIHLARVHRPDLILLDIHLPVLSGSEVVKVLRGDAALKDIPIIAVTALAMKGDKEAIIGSGIDAYISKPIAIGTYLSVIAEFLSMPAPMLEPMLVSE